MASSPITSWQIDGKTMKTILDFIFLDSKITAVIDRSHEIKRCLVLGRKTMTNFDSVLKPGDLTLPTKVMYSQNYDFSSSHVWKWELDYKKGWVPKNWYLQTVMVEKISKEASKEFVPINSKGNQPWIVIGKTDAEAETPILWPPDAKNWLTGKDLEAGKDWRQEEKGMTEDEMVGWHHRFNGHEFEQTPGNSEGQGSLTCCSLWITESDMT